MGLQDVVGAGVRSLPPRDAEFVYNESDGHLGHHMGVYFFEAADHPEAGMSHAEATRWITQRLGHDRMYTHRVRRVALDLDYPYWEPVQDLDVGAHVWVREVREPGWESVQDLMGELLSDRMDLSRPPWEVHVWTGIEGLGDLPGRLTAVVLKVHHCAADGLAMRTLAGKLFSDKLSPREAVATPSFIEARMLARGVLGVPGQISRFWRGLGVSRDAVAQIERAEQAGGLAHGEAERASTRFNGRMRGAASVEMLTLSGAAVRAIKALAPGATVNDVLLTVVGGALGRYLDECGERPKDSLVAMVPRSMRTVADWDSANQLAVLGVDMHTDISDPVERLAQVAFSAERAKARSSDPAVRQVAGRIDTAPALLLHVTGLARRLATYSADQTIPRHTMVSNIPGDVEGFRFAGARGVAVLASQPPIDGDGLRHFLVVARGGALTLSVIVNASVMPNPKRYVQLLRESFEELKESAGV